MIIVITCDNSNKHIHVYLKVVQTDETARKPDHVPVSSEDERNAVSQLEKALSSNRAAKSKRDSLNTVHKTGLLPKEPY